jgi:alkaline phosphatase D
MCGQLQAGDQPLNDDQWDGYQAARDLLFSQIENTPGGNVVVLTGDIHTSWAMDLSYDPLDPAVYTPETGEGSVAVEFVASAISSSGLPTLSSPTIVNIIRDLNPHIKFVNVAKRGFVLLDVRPERVQGDFYLIDQVETPGGTVEWETGWYTDSGTNRLRKAESATSAGRAADRPLAPIT